MKPKKLFFKYCKKCGKKFTPTGRYNKICLDCQVPRHKSNMLNRIKENKLK